MSVRILSDKVINQIAAGEVVERPASIVRELVQNALDADASDITVTLRDGGRAGVSVEDNGIGMSRTDALMSIERHATSKITRTEDLNEIDTLGFRGEALPSIAAVSHFTLSTRERGQEEGHRISIDGGTLRDVRPVGCPEGTRVEAKAIFYNLPARQKFLRRRETELHHCTEAVMREALIHPGTRFVLKHERRDLLSAPKADSLQERAQQLLGSLMRDAQETTFGNEQMTATLVYPPSDVHRPTAAGGMYLYVNGRYVRDTLIRRAILDATRDVIPRGRYPVLVLHLQLPANRVDVNASPNKTEVRFHEPLTVSEFLKIGLRRVWLSTTAGGSPRLTLGNSGRPPALPFEVHSNDSTSAPEERVSLAPQSEERTAIRLVEEPQEDEVELNVEEGKARFRDLTVLGQILGRFIICEHEDALFVVDQRQVCAALLLMTLKRHHRSGGVPSQRLLLPARVRLPQTSIDAISASKDRLSVLGIEVEHLNGVLAMRAIPAALQQLEAGGLLTELAQALAIDAPDAHLLSIMAEHSAIRSDIALDGYSLRSMLAALDEAEGVAFEGLVRSWSPQQLDQLFES